VQDERVGKLRADILVALEHNVNGTGEFGARTVLGDIPGGA